MAITLTKPLPRQIYYSPCCSCCCQVWFVCLSFGLVIWYPLHFFKFCYQTRLANSKLHGSKISTKLLQALSHHCGLLNVAAVPPPTSRLEQYLFVYVHVCNISSHQVHLDNPLTRSIKIKLGITNYNTILGIKTQNTLM